MDWNVVVSIYPEGFKRALRALARYGHVEPSSYYNVLVMSVDDPLQMLAAVEQQTEQNPALYDAIARVAPAMRSCEFHTAGEFLERAKLIALEWASDLAGKTFHVRIHRRGGPQGLHSTDAEKLIDAAITQATAAAGNSARISFDQPDAVIVIDTVGERAGISLWTGEDLARHRLLRPD